MDMTVGLGTKADWIGGSGMDMATYCNTNNVTLVCRYVILGYIT